MLITFARQSKAGVRTAGYSGERLVNLFLRPSDGISEGPLMGTSGSVEYVDLGAPIRAMIANAGDIYAVSGINLYKITSGVAKNLGTIANSGDVYMASNGAEVAIVSGGIYYVTDGTTLGSYSTGAVTKPISVTYQDGYFVVSGFIGTRGDALTVSALDDGTTFDALEFGYAENTPDAIKAVISDHGELWLFGSETVEVFYNSGAADFPFLRNSGALMEQGCLNGKTVAKEDNSVFWVRPDGAVLRASGTSPQIISTREIQEIIADNVVERGFTFTDRGHKFYAVILAGIPAVVYDLTTGFWHERSTGVGETEWFCTTQAAAGGVEYLGTSTGKLVMLDADVFDDDGAVIEAEAVSIPVEQNGDFFPVSKLHMNVRTGTIDIGRAPKIVLQTTKDGRTWSTEKWRDMGTIGEYFRRIVWHNLGSFRRAQFRLRITDPVPRDMYGMHYE